MSGEHVCHSCGHSTRVHEWTGRRPCREDCPCTELQED